MPDKERLPVPFFDRQSLYAGQADNFGRIPSETATRGSFIRQTAVDTFQAELAAHLGARHVVGIPDCTSAALLELWSYDVQPGDETIPPRHRSIAVAQTTHFADNATILAELPEVDWSYSVFKGLPMVRSTGLELAFGTHLEN